MRAVIMTDAAVALNLHTSAEDSACSYGDNADIDCSYRVRALSPTSAAAALCLSGSVSNAYDASRHDRTLKSHHKAMKRLISETSMSAMNACT